MVHFYLETVEKRHSMTSKKINEKNKHDQTIIPFFPDADYYFEKGVDAFYQRNYQVALKWIQNAIDADPDEFLYPTQLSIVYTEMGDYHIANQILKELSEEARAEYPELYYLMANNYAYLGLLTDAEKYAAMYLEKTTDGEFRSETEQLLTLLELGLSEDNDDISFSEEDDILAYQETSFYYLQRRDWLPACTILEEMIERYPDYLIAKQQYHYALFFAGKKKEALELEQKLFQQNPDSTYSITNLIIFYYEEGKLSEAKDLIKKLEKIYPLHFELSLRIAIAFAHVGELDKAYQRFRPLPKSKLNNHLEYYRYFAKTAFSLNEHAKAEKIWAEGCKRHVELTNEPLPWSSD